MSAVPAERRELAMAYRLALRDAQCSRGAACLDREGLGQRLITPAHESHRAHRS